MMCNQRDTIAFSQLAKFVYLFVVLELAFTAASQASEACMDCHDSLYEQELVKPHVHSPFRLKGCEKCHAAEFGGWTSEEDYSELSKKIRWLTRKSTPSLEHWLDFSAIGIEKTLYLEALLGKSKYRQQIVIPKLDKLIQFKADRQLLTISDLKTVEVQLGVFVTATIAWKTDKISTSFVNYGLNKAYEFTSDKIGLGREHRITIDNLKPNKIYWAQAISRDVFGNESTSNIFQISTKKGFEAAEEGEPTSVIQTAYQKPSISHALYKINDRYLLHITANQPIKLNVGALPVIPGKNLKKIRSPHEDFPDDHVKLKGPAETCIYICYDCHKDYNKISTHPVNVGPKLGMVIPSDYPTLPNGNISCISCHAPHANNREFLLLKSSKKDLCIGCHKEMA